MTDDILRVVRDVRVVLREPRYWTQGFYARNAKGDRRYPDAPDAICFCIVGAIRRAAASENLAEETAQALRRFLPEPFKYLSKFNDMAERTHAEILALVDRCIDARRHA